MRHTANDDVLADTTKCAHSFSCLETGKCGDRPMCEVHYHDGKNVLFLKDKEFASCPYRISFAGSQVCTCPTHYAIQCR